MAELPTMPLYTDAYLSDTKHLSTLEHGAYLLLLISMWRAGGSLPNEPALLARYAGIPPRNWPRVWAIIGPLFQIEGERILQKRLVSTYKKAMDKKKKYSANGQRGAEAKALKSKDAAPAIASGSLPVRSSEAQAYLNPQSLIPNREDSGATAPGALPKRRKRKKPESEMTPEEAEKKRLFDRGQEIGFGPSLIGRLFNAYGGNEAMPGSTARARRVIEESVGKRDKRSYVGAIIRKIGEEQVEKARGGWDPAL